MNATPTKTTRPPSMMEMISATNAGGRAYRAGNARARMDALVVSEQLTDMARSRAAVERACGENVAPLDARSLRDIARAPADDARLAHTIADAAHAAQEGEFGEYSHDSILALATELAALRAMVK